MSVQRQSKLESIRRAQAIGAAKRNLGPVDSLPVLQELRRIRAAKGLTQAQMAKLCGYSQTHISLVELGRHMPSIYFLIDYAEALGQRFTITLLDGGEG